MPIEHAATFPTCYLTAAHALFEVGGLKRGETLMIHAAGSGVSTAAIQLAKNVGAIVLECTNMVPYAPHLREQLGLPVYSIYTFVQWFHAGLMPRVFEPWLLDQRLLPASQ